jgi:predicted anti-sigma-YlaC factor YlaD
MNTCENIQQAISAGPLSVENQKHLEQCADCQGYAAAVKTLLENTVDFEPSTSLNESILQFAKENRPTSAKPKSAFYFWLSVSAALLAFAFVMTKIISSTSSSDDQITETVPTPKLPVENQVDNMQEIVSVPTTEEIDRLLEDDLLSIEMGAIEGELFVLGSEFLN